MNSFSHALPFLNRGGGFCIGCALPDWLGAVDRKCRVRTVGASKLLDSENRLAADLAAGIIQHIDDDRWFHSGETFMKLNLELAIELREILAESPGFRPGFLGHIIIELLLDGFLHERNPQQLDEFYSMVSEADPAAVEQAVNSMSTRPTEKLKEYFPIFLRERYLYDYIDDERLIYRINHVLKRVKLEPVGDSVLQWVPSVRKRVYGAAPQLLEKQLSSAPSQPN